MALCAGVHKLSKQQLEKIQKGINALAEELVAIKIKKLRISKRQVKMSKTGQNILFTLIPNSLSVVQLLCNVDKRKTWITLFQLFTSIYDVIGLGFEPRTHSLEGVFINTNYVFDLHVVILFIGCKKDKFFTIPYHLYALPILSPVTQPSPILGLFLWSYCLYFMTINYFSFINTR